MGGIYWDYVGPQSVPCWKHEVDFLKGIHFCHVVVPEQLREHYSLLEEGCARAGLPAPELTILSGSPDAALQLPEASA